MAMNITAGKIDYESSNIRDSLYIVQLYMRLLKDYDINLYGHSIRVARYGYTLAHKIGLSSTLALDIAIGGILHDIGKINIPLDILNKSEKLTTHEWEEMKQHPTTGHNMLLPFRELFSSTVFDIVKYHHCKLDLTGYPNNINQQQLSTAVRVITIADSYDAMTNTRSYSSAKNKKEAIKELIVHSNTQFDTYIASQFIDFIESNQALLPLPHELA